MANAQRGEVEFAIPGGKTYTLVLNTNAIAAIETRCRKDDGRDVMWEEFFARITQKRSVSAVIVLIWAMARKHHPEITVEGAGDLLDEVGGVAAVRAIIDSAAGAMTPDPVDLKALGVDAPSARPRKARPTTTAGVGSTSRRAVSA